MIDAFVEEILSNLFLTTEAIIIVVCAYHCSSEVSASLHTPEIPGSSPRPKFFFFFFHQIYECYTHLCFLISGWSLSVAMVLIFNGNTRQPFTQNSTSTVTMHCMSPHNAQKYVSHSLQLFLYNFFYLVWRSLVTH